MPHVPGHNVEQSGNVFAWNPQEWGYGSPIPGVTKTEDNPWGANANQLQRANYLATGNINYGGQPQEVSQNTSDVDLAKLIAALSSGGSGSGSGSSDRLARDKFEYEKRKDALERAAELEATNYARAREGRVTSGLESLYGGGKGTFNEGFNNLLKMIADQGKVSEDATGRAYARAMENINQGYTAAQGLGDEGYRALNAYLAANQNNPYATMQAQVGSAPDALSNYLSAYGVSDLPVRGQIEADQLQAQQGAANYQNLINLLSGVAQQGAGSRATESQMAQLLFNTGLGQERAGYRSEAENAQAQALAALQQAMFQSRFGVENDRNAYARQLAEAVINAGGNPSGSGSGSGSGNDENDGNAVVRPLPGQLLQTATPQEIVANQLANLVAPAQAQNSTAQQLLDELNARRGR
jgi:hypothetical protein